MSTLPYTDKESAEALSMVVGNTPWLAVTLSHAYLASLAAVKQEHAARDMYQQGPLTLDRSRELLRRAVSEGFVAVLPK
jgi:hypothetical protein